MACKVGGSPAHASSQGVHRPSQAALGRVNVEHRRFQQVEMRTQHRECLFQVMVGVIVVRSGEQLCLQPCAGADRLGGM